MISLITHDACWNVYTFIIMLIFINHKFMRNHTHVFFHKIMIFIVALCCGNPNAKLTLLPQNNKNKNLIMSYIIIL